MDNGNASYERYLKGDSDALYELVDEYKTGLVFYINSIVADLSLAEEIMLDTFARLIIKKPRYLGKSSFKTWLYAIGRNIAIDTLKKRKRVVPLDEAENYIFDEEGLEESYLADEKKLTVRRAVNNLKDEHSQALWLVYFEGFSNEEAARIMKKTSHQFDSLLYRAKAALRRELEKGDFDYDEYK